jgi:hypothetical protein
VIAAPVYLARALLGYRAAEIWTPRLAGNPRFARRPA